MSGGRRNNRKSRFSGRKDEFKHEQNKHADNISPDGIFGKNKITQNERLRRPRPRKSRRLRLTTSGNAICAPRWLPPAKRWKKRTNCLS